MEKFFSYSGLGCALAAVLCVLWGSTNAQAIASPVGPLLIDFQDVGGDTLSGYQAYEATNQDLSSLGAVNYSGALPATVEITVANLPDGASDFRVVDRLNFNQGTDEVADWIGIDARLGEASPTAGNPRPSMDVIVSGLADGVYSWSSLHHDTLNQTGVISYSFTDANGMSIGSIDNSAGDETADPAMFTTFDTAFTSVGGGPITLSMTVTEPEGGLFGVTKSFAFRNSLEITQIPEPATLAMMSLGLACLGVMRRR